MRYQACLNIGRIFLLTGISQDGHIIRMSLDSDKIIPG